MEFCEDVKFLVCVLTILFGMGSWITVNGVFIELPILVGQLPEGWSLPSYLTVVVQVANIGPLVYTVWSLMKPNHGYEKSFVFVLIFVCSAAVFLLAFFWNETSEIGEMEHSTALFILTFILSIVACMSSVVFLPFMNSIKSRYITPFFIGMGFSGLVPSLVALGQGVGQGECKNTSAVNMTTNVTVYWMYAYYQPPNFPVKYFFLFIFTMMVICGISFVMLNYLPYCKTEHVCTLGKNIPVHENGVDETANLRKSVHPDELASRMSGSKIVYYLILVVWLNALLNGVLLSVQSYACLPYGYKFYHLSVTLSNIADPAAGFLAFFKTVNTAGGIGCISLVGTTISAYLVVVAASSPTPMFVMGNLGGMLVVVAYVMVYFTLTYSKISIAALFRGEGRKALLWCGAATQTGAAIGSIVMFVVVNVYDVFEQPILECLSV